MSMLTPLFLLGLITIALPIWLHRMNTQSPERKKFSSAMLLEKSTQQTHMKKRLQYLLLLAFRILFLLFMVIAFTKPIISKPPVIAGGEGAVLHMVVLDTSFSMGYGAWMSGAKAMARQIVDNMENEDLVQIISASNGTEILGNPTNIEEEAIAQINNLDSGFGHLDLGNLMSNLDRLVADYGQAVVIHLISDLQEGALPAKFADLIPESLKNNLVGLTLHPIVDEDIINLYVDSINRTDTGLEVGIRGNIASPIEAGVSLKINGEISKEVNKTVSPSGLTIFEFSEIEFESGENRVEANILREDPLAGDNSYFAVIDNTPPRPILLITADIESLSVKYLTAAVETGQQGYTVEPVAVNSLDPRTLQRYPWLIVDDLGIINDILAQAIIDYIDSSGAVFAALGEKSISLSSIPVLNTNVRSSLLSASVPHSVARIDSSHPLLAETSGWRDINVSRYLSFDMEDSLQTLVSLENGAPLVLEQKIGLGRLLLLTSSLDNKQNDIPIRPVFVNFMAEAAKYLSGDDQLKQNQIAGDYLQLVQTGSNAGQVIDPDGRNILSLAETRRIQDIKLNRTGFYEIYTSDSEALIAVNTDLRESELSIMNDEAISAWRDALTNPQISTAMTGPVNIEQESIELWHILLIVMGIVVLAESVIGNIYLATGRGYV